MTTITIDESLEAEIHAVAAPDEDIHAFMAAAAKDAVARRKRLQAQGRAEMQAMLDGPRHRFDAEASYQRDREKYGWPDLSHMTREELADDAERIVAAMDPKVREGLERDGWL